MSRIVSAQGSAQICTTGVDVGAVVRVAVGAGVDATVGVGVGCVVARALVADATLEGAAVGGLLVAAVGAGGAPEQAVSNATTTINAACVARGKAVTWTAIRPASPARRMCNLVRPGHLSSVR